MRKGQDRKVNNVGAGLNSASVGSFVGRTGCLGLLALGLALVSPICENASALTSEELESGSLTSSVSIGFAPVSGSTTLSPTGAAGASGLISVLANVGVTNSGGYSVYLGSGSPNLVGKNNTTNVIPGVSGEVSFANLQDNTWGYYAGEGSSIPESATYKSVSQGQGEVIFANNNSRVKDENKTFVLGFAAKITNSVPADTYENQVTLSVVSNPYQLTLMDIDNMQDMTSQICENTPGLATKQLKDVRDGKYYWVTKLADNKCWMTQNLALDLSTNPDQNDADANMVKTFSDVDTDLNSKSSWTPTSKTFGTVTSATILTDNIGQRSWNLGSYYIKEPNNAVSCGTRKNSLADCTEYFDELDVPASANGDVNAHYLASHYYQWNAATAGSGGTITSGQAEDSICPKEWRLPTSNTSGEFEVLVTALGGTFVDNITKAPFYGVRGGSISQNAGWLFAYAGGDGRYWAATPTSNGTSYALGIYGDTDDVNPSNIVNSRSSGCSVRCVAR